MADAPLDPPDDEDTPWIVAVCPLTPTLAAQIAGMTELDWTDHPATEQAMLAAGWRFDGDGFGDLEERAHTPAGHLVYGDDCFSMPFAYEYYVHPDGVMGEDYWGALPGWHSLLDPPDGTFTAQLQSVVDTFTALLGPPDYDVTHEPRPALNYTWRYRAWHRGDNVLVVAPGLDGFSYAQFEHAFVQIQPLASGTALPPARELPDFFW